MPTGRMLHSTELRQKGFTVIELMVTVIVLFIVVTVGIPAYMSLLERQRLRGTAEVLYAQLQLARSEAIKQNHEVYVDFDPGTDWCVGFDDTSPCDCSATNDCQIGGVEKVIRGTDYRGIVLASTTLSGNQTEFLPRNGTVSPDGEALFQGATIYSLKVVLSPLGRVKICSDSPGLGYSPC